MAFEPGSKSGQKNRFLSRTFTRAEEKIDIFRSKFEKTYKQWLHEILIDGTKALEEYEFEIKKRQKMELQKKKRGRRRASADSAISRRRTRSPSGESVIEATSLTNLPSAQDLRIKVREETKMSGLSLSSIKAPPPFKRPSLGGTVDHNANEEKQKRRSSDIGNMPSQRASPMLQSPTSPKPTMTTKTEGIDRNSADYHERTGLMRRSGRKSSVEKRLEQELKTAEGTQKEPPLGEVVEQESYKVLEQEVFTDIQVENVQGQMTKTNFVYSQPRLQPHPGGSRVLKATGKLLNQYEEDQSFSHTGTEKEEEVHASVRDIKQNLNRSGGRKSKEKEELEKELEVLRETAGDRQMGNESSDDENKSMNVAETDVKFRRPLTSIKTKYLAKTKGEKIYTSSDSDDDLRKAPERVEIIGSSLGVKSVSSVYTTNEIPWQHPVVKQDPRKEIEHSSFNEAKKYYVENENIIPWQHPVEKLDPKQDINTQAVTSTIGYYRKIEGQIPWQHPVERLDPKSEIEREVVKSTLTYYKEIEGAIPWQHPIVREDPRQEIDDAVFKSAKTYYQQNEGEIPWQHPVEKMNAKEEIDAAYMQEASTYFKEIEMQNGNQSNKPLQKPVVNIVQDPLKEMAKRRLKVDEGFDYEDGPADHPSRRTNKEDVINIDKQQIREFRDNYKRLEDDANKKPELMSQKPKTKLIDEDSTFDVMAKHRRKCGEDDNDYYSSERRRDSYEVEQKINREIDVHQVRESRETYRMLESRKDDHTPINKPKTRYLGFDDAQLRMEQHKTRVEQGDVDMNRGYSQQDRTY